MKKIRPLPGYAFVRMEGIYDSGAGPIVIPEKYKSRRIGIGTLTAASPREKDNQSISGDYAQLIGSRVIFHDFSKAPVDEQIFRIPIANILAIITDPNIKIQSVSAYNNVERCQWCGPAKPGSPNSMILDIDGHCPRCGKNANGEPRPTTFTDRELDPFRNPEWENHKK